jgi:outer membrane protein assembly factor BamC
MVHSKRLLLALITPLVFSGCGVFGGDFFRDRSGDYRNAESTPALTIPPNLDSSAINSYYPIPGIGPNAPLSSNFEVPRPMRLAGNNEESIKIKSLDYQRWILASMAPGQVWPRLRDFLITRSIGLANENGGTGIIESNWLTKADDDPYRERYKIAVVQGLQRNSSEISVLQYQEEKVGVPGAISWGERSVDAAREKIVLDEFAQYLAETIDATSSVSLKAQGINTARRMYLVSGEAPILRFDLARERGWASVNFALGQAGFTVNDMDSSLGAFYVTYDGPQDEVEEKVSFWRFLNPFAWGDDDEWPPTDYRIRMTDGSDDGWLELRVEKDAEQNPNEFETMLNEIKGDMS